MACDTGEAPAPPDDRLLLRSWRAMRPVADILAEFSPVPPEQVLRRLAELLEGRR